MKAISNVLSYLIILICSPFLILMFLGILFIQKDIEKYMVKEIKGE